jgi:asparagine synthase (glutamine-hydrolysing)
MVWHQDEPFQSTSIFAQWCVMRLAHRTGVTVLLDGQGADELLGGYGPFGVHVADLLAKARIATAIREMRLARSVTGLNLARPLAYSLIGRLPGAARVALSDIRMRQSIETSGLRGDLRERLSDWMHEEGGAYPEIHHLHNMEDH